MLIPNNPTYQNWLFEGEEPASPSPLRKAKSVGKLPWWRRASGQKEKESKRVVNQPSSGSDWDGLDDRTKRRDQRMALNYAQRNVGLNSGEILFSQGLNTFPPPGLCTITHGICTPIDELPEYDGDCDSDSVIVFNKSSEGSESNSYRSNARESNRQSSLSKAKTEKPAELVPSKKGAESRLRHAGNANDSSWSDIVESFAPKKGFFKTWFRKKSKAGYRVDRK
jgi:hypothetical protein